MTAGLARLDDDAAHQVVAARGLPDGAGTSLYRWRDDDVLLLFSGDDVVGVKDVLAVPVAGTVRDAEQLVETVLSMWSVDRVLVRVDARARLPLVPLSTVVERPSGPPRSAEGLDARPVAPDTLAAVHGWLRTAFVRGYHAIGFDDARIDVAALDERIESLGVGTAALPSVVAFEDGRPIGHVTWSPNAVDLLGRRSVTILDTFVDEQARGRRIGTRLLSWVEADARAASLPVQGDVVAGPMADDVLAALVDDGWSPVHRLYGTPLRPR